MKSLHLQSCGLLLLFLLLPTLSWGSPASSSVPLDSWVYPALDKLAGLGLVDSVLQGTRPYSRLEVARQVAAALADAALDRRPPSPTSSWAGCSASSPRTSRS